MASRFVTDAKQRPTHRESLIKTEMGTFFILTEDLSTGEIASRRVSTDEAHEFQDSVESQTAQETGFPEVP